MPLSMSLSMPLSMSLSISISMSAPVIMPVPLVTMGPVGEFHAKYAQARSSQDIAQIMPVIGQPKQADSAGQAVGCIGHPFVAAFVFLADHRGGCKDLHGVTGWKAKGIAFVRPPFPDAVFKQDACGYYQRLCFKQYGSPVGDIRFGGDSQKIHCVGKDGRNI